MSRSLSLPLRFVLLVFLVVVVPLGLMGFWLAGTAARSGEDLLRSRLRETNARASAEIARNWLRPRSALLSFAELDEVQETLRARRGGEAGSPAPSATLWARFEALPGWLVELTVRDREDAEVWRFARGPAGRPTFSVRMPIHLRSTADTLGTVEARLFGEAILGEGTALASALGAVVAVIDPETGASLRALPFGPSVLSMARFQWDGEDWVAERRALSDPRLEVISAAPLAEFSAPFQAAAGRGITALLAVALLATGVATIAARRMTSSLGRLAGAADRVSQGDFTTRLPPGRGDEVGRVTQAFNQMIEGLKGMVAELSQREALAAVGSFASELAHEVRNPLTAIRVDLQFVEEQLPEGSEARSVQRAALEEVLRLDRTVAGVLQIARSGRIALGPIDLRDPLRAAAHAVQPIADDAGSRLSMELPGEPVHVGGDRDALQQFFTNLLVNAAQAVSKGGEIALSLTVASRSAVVTVRDDGVGISEGDLERVRDPFYSTRPEGTGLGLAVADRIAAADHAALTIESEPGRGTTVTVRFELPPAPPDTESAGAL